MTQYNISDCYNFDEIVHVKGNVYAVNEQVKQDFFKCAENKSPCGYAWTEFDPTDFLSMIDPWNKEGQASTGNIYQRITDFGNLKPQLITHIIISDVFKKSGFGDGLYDIMTSVMVKMTFYHFYFFGKQKWFKITINLNK